jgi:S-adenosylmethionine decarboxylase
MKNPEPRIFRKRLIVEGRHSISIDADTIKQYLVELAEKIGMRLLIEPVIFSPDACSHPLHHGIAGFVGWVESGGFVYTWDKFNFFTVEIYTCKPFSTKDAVQFTKEFFKAPEIEFMEI